MHGGGSQPPLFVLLCGGLVGQADVKIGSGDVNLFILSRESEKSCFSAYFTNERLPKSTNNIYLPTL